MMKNASRPILRGFAPAHHGFTLIELVVAMVIAAILAAIAIRPIRTMCASRGRTEARPYSWI